MAEPLKVHITGVYGLIGNVVYQHLSRQEGQYDLYGSGRRQASSQRTDDDAVTQLPADRFRIADLSDANAVEQALEGMDAVLHIGAVPDPDASFDDVLDSNIRGTYNVLEACRKVGIGRLVYASSIMATWGYSQFVEPYCAIREERIGDIPDDFAPVKHTDQASRTGLFRFPRRLAVALRGRCASKIYPFLKWPVHRTGPNCCFCALL